MRFEQLNCLLEVERAGSITGAAQRLFITQQAVSLNIKQLEKELNCSLLIRTKNGVQLTENGKKTLAFAKNVLQEKEKFLQDLAITDELVTIPIVEYKICSTSAVINYVLPTVLNYTEVQEEKVRINITNADTFEDVLTQIADGKRELGLVTINAKELETRKMDEKIAVDILCHDEIVGVFNKRLFERHGKQKIELLELLHESYPKTLYNIIPIEPYSIERGDYVACSTDAGFHRNMLEKHEAVAFMPRLAYEYFFSSKKYMALSVKDEGEFDFPFVHAAIYLKENEKLEKFVKHIKKEMNVKQD